MKNIAVVLFTWWFIAGAGTHNYVGIQFGPFKEKSDCQEVVDQQKKRLLETSTPAWVYVSKCWES